MAMTLNCPYNLHSRSRLTWPTVRLLVSVILLSHTGIVTSNETVSCSSYEGVMNRYFTALSSGDTADLSNLLAEQYLLRKKTVLSNPSYSVYLRSQYENASWQLLRCSHSPSGPIEIETQVRLPSQESRNITFLLNSDSHSGDLKITGEKGNIFR